MWDQFMVQEIINYFNQTKIRYETTAVVMVNKVEYKSFYTKDVPLGLTQLILNQEFHVILHFCCKYSEIKRVKHG